MALALVAVLGLAFGGVAVVRAATCGDGRGDCDDRWWNGCETELATPSACGACGVVCGSLHGTPACVSGACAIECDPGFGNCDGDSFGGCEAMLATDPHHCGRCDVACPSGKCRDGTCVPVVDRRSLDERLPPIPQVVPKGAADFVVGALQIDGPLPEPDVRRVIERHGRKTRACYAAGLDKSPSLTGLVRVELEVAADGKVRSARSAPGTDLPDADVARCVIEALGRRAFPAAEDGSRVVAPLLLRRNGAP